MYDYATLDKGCAYLQNTVVHLGLSGRFPAVASALINHATQALATPELREEGDFSQIMAAAFGFADGETYAVLETARGAITDSHDAYQFETE